MQWRTSHIGVAQLKSILAVGAARSAFGGTFGQKALKDAATPPSQTKANPVQPSKTMMRLALLSLVLSVVTFSLIGFLGTHLPYSGWRDWMVTALTLPGLALATLAYPQGIHTGGGAPAFGLLAIAVNLLVYAGVWSLILWGAKRLMRKRSPP